MHAVRLVLVISSVAAVAQTYTPPPPQEARQALIEMFLGKGAGDFTKHLPSEARKALIRKGDTPETALALRIGSIVREIAAQGGRIETFEVGPNILVSDDPNTHQKIEVAVEHDSLLGEEDEIELSVHTYRDGLPESLPVLPSLIFRMKQENDIWRLTEVILSAHIPLTDPEYLKGLRQKQDNSNESGARVRMAMIAEAENQYASDHREAGYSCSLTTLFPPQSDAGEQYSAAGFTNEEANAYRFSLTGCNGPPVSKYRLMAVPIDPESEMKVLCTDQSGAIKSISRENESSCFSRGQAATQVGLTAP